MAALAAQDPLPPLPAPAPLLNLPGTAVKISIPEAPSLVRWSVGLPSAPSSPPLVAGRRVFVPSLPGLVIAYDLKDGRELWREPMAADQPLAGFGEMLFVAAGEAVHALRQADGGVAWRRPTGTATAPLLAKDGWVIAAAARKIFALRATDGAVVWSAEVGRQDQRAVIEGDTLFVPLASGRLRAFDLATGAAKWERRIGGAPAEPLVVGDRVYFGATDKNFYCVNIGTGEVDWKFRVGAAIRGRAATDGDRIFFAGLDNLVRALGRESGAQRWQQGVPFRPLTGPVVAGASVMITGPASEVWLLNPLTGRDAGKISFPEALAMAPAIASVRDGIVVIGVSGGLTEAWKLWFVSPTVAPEKLE